MISKLQDREFHFNTREFIVEYVLDLLYSLFRAGPHNVRLLYPNYHQGCRAQAYRNLNVKLCSRRPGSATDSNYSLRGLPLNIVGRVICHMKSIIRHLAVLYCQSLIGSGNVDLAAAIAELLGLLLHAGDDGVLGFQLHFCRVITDVLCDLHRAEVGSAH